MTGTGETLLSIRQKMALPQETMASALNVAVRSYQRYEKGESPCPPDVALKVAQIAGSDKLLWQMMQHNPYWQQLMPPVENKPMSQAACALQVELAALMGSMTKLFTIASDDRIDPHEQDVWRGIDSSLSRLAQRTTEMRIAAQ